jgi:murein DD-endopeptidase MepM/ murein hydrolase activator NlpD
MPAPQLTLTVEPSQAGAVLYGPLAAGTAFGEQAAQLSIRVWIKNNEPTTVVINTIALSFVPPPLVNPVTISVDLSIGPGETKLWNFATKNNIILPEPPPPTFTLSAWCNGFSDPATVANLLDPHINPVSGGAYLFPARADELRDGEFWQGRSALHSAAGSGVQLFGYDLGVVGYETQQDGWTDLLPDGSINENEDYRVWGKRIYAMADGTVHSWENSKPSNPNPPADLVPPDTLVEGNHFYIQHGPEIMLYAHFQPGSLNEDLMSHGAPVSAGDFLGLAGNSGNSTGPHLHIHATRGTAPWQGPPQPITFRDSWVIDRTALSPPSPKGPWVKLQGTCLPAATSLIWPNAVVPLPWRVDLSSYRAIDPLALILSGEVYVKLTLPDPPPFEVLRAYARALARSASSAEKRQALNRARALRAYAEAVEQELAALGVPTKEAADAEIPHD